MNDEPAPPTPALRLKPRLRPADGQAPAAVPLPDKLPAFMPPPAVVSDVAPASPTSPDAIPAPKIRFKPRLEGNTAQASGPAEPVAAIAPNLSSSDTMQGVSPPPAMDNPRVTAPAPPLFVTPSAPVTPPPLFISDTAPAPTVPVIPAPSPASDGGKFKLKPKLSPLAVPSATAAAGEGAVSPVIAAPPTGVPPVFAPPPVAPPPVTAVKAPPPFPVMAPSGAATAVPPLASPPPAAASATNAMAEQKSDSTPPMVPVRRKGSGSGILKLAALVVLAGAGFFAWKHFTPSSAPASPPPAKKSPGTPPATANTSPTPSDTLNALAHVPANAINKAQDAIATRRASGQSRIDAASIGEDLPDRPFGPAPAAPTSQTSAPSKPANTVTTTTVSPGVTATAHVEAAVEASASFRSFVANAKVSGVYQGPPSRAVINGRLTRVGEVIDPMLGIIFDGVDSARRHLLFKDKAGATVSRRF